MTWDSTTRGGEPLGVVMADLHPNDHLDPPLSHLWAWSLIGMLGLFLIRSRLRRRALVRRGQEADAAVDKHAELRPGMRFVYGRVELAEGCDSAVSVHIEQTGSERKNKNNWSHEWKEIDRKTFVNPFYVRTNKGERVRVEPGPDVLLVDTPDGVIWPDRTSRTRIAALSPNEAVIVEGALSRGHDPEQREAAGYRGSAQGWLMKPLPFERMHLSAENLGDRHRKRAGIFQSAALTLAIVLGIVNLLFSFYHGSLFLGQDTTAEVTDKRTFTTKNSKGRVTHHYEVTFKVDAPGEPERDHELDSEDWAGVSAGMTLAYRDVPSFRQFSNPGHGASVHAMILILTTIASFVGLGVYAGASMHTEWYEGRLDDQGSGRLPEPPKPKA